MSFKYIKYSVAYLVLTPLMGLSWSFGPRHLGIILQDDMGNKILKEVCLCLIIEYIKINNNISQKFDFTMTLLAKYNYCTAPYSDKIKKKEKKKKRSSAINTSSGMSLVIVLVNLIIVSCVNGI